MQRKKWQNCCGSLVVASQQTVRFRISPRSLGAAVAHFSSSTPICCALEQGHFSQLVGKGSGLGMIWDRLWNWRTCGICKFHVKFVVNGMDLAEAFLNALDWLIKRKNCQWNPLDVVGCQFHKPFPMACHKWMGKTSINLSPDGFACGFADGTHQPCRLLALFAAAAFAPLILSQSEKWQSYDARKTSQISCKFESGQWGKYGKMT